MLDCIGDFAALIGTDLTGDFPGGPPGHHTNHEVVRQLLRASAESTAAAAWAFISERDSRS